MDADTPDVTANAMGKLVGRVLGNRYRVDNVVSVGAYTVICEAIDTEENRPVTLKIVRPELVVASTFRLDFQRQVEVAMSLSHANIAAVLDWGETEIDAQPTPYWVVEYLGGGSLRDLFDRGRLLAPSQALVVGLEACRALEAAHERGVVHTEITPSKLVFGEDGRLRITDFALARILGAEAWSEPATVATHVARYASPEQALSLGVDVTTDIYALSLCLIESMTGKVPFAGDSTVATLSARVGKLMPVTADMGSLASVLERGGRPDPADRWTAAEFAAALVAAAESLPRPDPIPVLASSLFAASLASRVPAPAEPDVASTLEVAAEPLAQSDEGGFPPPLLLVADVADPPTGVVQVASDAAPVSDNIDQQHGPVGGPVADELAPTIEIPAAAVAAMVDHAQAGVLYDDERPMRPWGKYLFFSLLAIIAVGLLSLAGWILLRPKTFEVPDLTGVDEAVARNEIAGNGWVIETRRERSDDVPELDHVVRTIPAAGDRLAEGKVFVIVVSDGFELRTLPELTGMALPDALRSLDELRLTPVEAPAEFSEDVPVGTVIRWQVRDDAALSAGAQVLPDTAVEITASLGPEPRPAPDLTGLTADEATAALDALQLVTARGDDVYSSDVEAGRVAVQDPAAGSPVERGGTVTFQLSKGPELLPLPDLTGLSYPAAEAALADAGFTISSLLGTTEGTFVSMSVDGVETAAGANFPRGTGIDLIFL